VVRRLGGYAAFDSSPPAIMFVAEPAKMIVAPHSPDNAACEGFFGRLKTELFYPRNWQDITIDQFIQIVDSYIRWYNEKRIKISLGSLSPIEYRASLGFTT